MSWVYEPVQVGIMGGSGCRCGLGICNPSLTSTCDMGSWVLPVSVVESHAVTKPMKDCTNHPQTAHHNTEQGQLPMNSVAVFLSWLIFVLLIESAIIIQTLCS